MGLFCCLTWKDGGRITSDFQYNTNNKFVDHSSFPRPQPPPKSSPRARFPPNDKQRILGNVTNVWHKAPSPMAPRLGSRTTNLVGLAGVTPRGNNLARLGKLLGEVSDGLGEAYAHRHLGLPMELHLGGCYVCLRQTELKRRGKTSREVKSGYYTG